MSFEPRFYLRILWNRFPVFLLVFVLVTAAGFVVATTLPKLYRAQAALLAEAPQIPNDLAASTVRLDFSQQLQVIQQRLMSRETMLDIADRLDLFADRPELQPGQIVAIMQDRIELNILGGRGAVTLLLISAEAEDPETSVQIVNDLMTRVLEQDASYRTEVATNTLAFFEAEVRRLGEELDYFNRRILEYQNNNIDALPETLDYRLSRQALLQERLSQARREIGQLTDQRRRLVELFEMTGRTDAATNRPLSPEEQELAGLRAELRQALAIFSETNPRVTVLRTQIEQLEAVIAARLPQVESEDPGAGVFRAQLVEIDSQIEALQESSAELEADIEVLRETVERTPRNAITLGALQRDRSNIQSQYNNAVDRLSAAATGERIEVLSKGQRLSVVEQPVLPTQTTNPSPVLIMAAAVAAGIGLGLAAVALLEIMAPRIRRPSQIVNGLGITPLATVPYIDTPGEVWRHRAYRLAAFVLVAAALTGGLFIINDAVMPLEQIAQELLDRSRL